ncbi:single-stranded DNA-binding protein [Companilactobacillus nodensis]|uniref:Single-stranded DNA-binding protein n=1 Tax=Companilactobacillus nodensis DSM 19682 = JCM 14932 = NBRC 107160 TaxID=1423775 RepID=A0A0R1KD29_9LACO|nr:single-stranded DNA-binding protein [Companilactobacillus nodensis]KRK78777.1 single-strand DNA-binding protein [Companilactobacillus nodensis DSM 19682 = JCM 14932 = NBRC 107160]
MINRVVLVGRLTRDAELRYTSSDQAVTSFTLAVNRQFTNSKGEREADFINCVIWRKAAESFANFTSKGSLVGIDGRIQTRSYENQQGQRIYVTEVVSEKFSLLESKAEKATRESNSNQQNSNNAPAASNSKSDDVPEPYDYDYEHKNGISNGNDPFVDSSKPINISDDDLPF